MIAVFAAIELNLTFRRALEQLDEGARLQLRLLLAV